MLFTQESSTDVSVHLYVYVQSHYPQQGLGLLSAGLSALARSSGAQHNSKHSYRSLPTDKQIIVLFVVGGFTPQELQEVYGVTAHYRQYSVHYCSVCLCRDAYAHAVLFSSCT
jgi:hypothetical protein